MTFIKKYILTSHVIADNVRGIIAHRKLNIDYPFATSGPTSRLTYKLRLTRAVILHYTTHGAPTNIFHHFNIK